MFCSITHKQQGHLLKTFSLIFISLILLLVCVCLFIFCFVVRQNLESTVEINKVFNFVNFRRNSDRPMLQKISTIDKGISVSNLIIIKHKSTQVFLCACSIFPVCLSQSSPPCKSTFRSHLFSFTHTLVITFVPIMISPGILLNSNRGNSKLIFYKCCHSLSIKNKLTYVFQLLE